jgi:hypothetical protein
MYCGETHVAASHSALTATGSKSQTRQALTGGQANHGQSQDGVSTLVKVSLSLQEKVAIGAPSELHLVTAPAPTMPSSALSLGAENMKLVGTHIHNFLSLVGSFFGTREKPDTVLALLNKSQRHIFEGRLYRLK